MVSSQAPGGAYYAMAFVLLFAATVVSSTTVLPPVFSPPPGAEITYTTHANSWFFTPPHHNVELGRSQQTSLAACQEHCHTSHPEFNYVTWFSAQNSCECRMFNYEPGVSYVKHGGDMFDVHFDRDVWGHDMQVFNTSVPAQCREACSNTDWCQLAFWNSPAKRCYLRRGDVVNGVTTSVKLQGPAADDFLDFERLTYLEADSPDNPAAIHLGGEGQSLGGAGMHIFCSESSPLAATTETATRTVVVAPAVQCSSSKAIAFSGTLIFDGVDVTDCVFVSMHPDASLSITNSHVSGGGVLGMALSEISISSSAVSLFHLLVRSSPSITVTASNFTSSALSIEFSTSSVFRSNRLLDTTLEMTEVDRSTMTNTLFTNSPITLTAIANSDIQHNTYTNSPLMATRVSGGAGEECAAPE